MSASWGQAIAKSNHDLEKLTEAYVGTLHETDAAVRKRALRHALKCALMRA
jgi:hypothetical protein